jgi:hypothetical protein
VSANPGGVSVAALQAQLDQLVAQVTAQKAREASMQQELYERDHSVFFIVVFIIFFVLFCSLFLWLILHVLVVSELLRANHDNLKDKVGFITKSSQETISTLHDMLEQAMYATYVLFFQSCDLFSML